MPVLNTGLAKVSGGDFTLDQSLRFNNDDSAYLSKTFASAGNRKTWTLSFWVKRTGAGGYLFFAHSGNNDTDYGGIALSTNGTIALNAYDDAMATSVPKYRDPSAWYHYVVAVDTTQAVEANRVKFYTNGEQLTPTIGGSYPAQNDDMAINAATGHSIGSENPYSDGSFIDDYLAEMHFIDGTALDHTSFGEEGDYGEWKPKEVSGLTYGTNGFYLSFAGGGIMSATGGDSTDTDGDYKAASFTQDGTFTPSADGYVEYLVIAGGGGGGSADNDNAYSSGGGGAGGYRTGYLAVTGSTAYSITVGDGGAGGTGHAGSGSQGEDSVFSTITSVGGGYGGTANANGGAGGSGGGAGVGFGASTRDGGSATSGQGYDGGGAPAGGGALPNDLAGGGGGAGEVGAHGSSGGTGGDGLASSITGSSVTRAGGGGGDAQAGGSGGGGGSRDSGTANTGGGGGGSSEGGNPGAGPDNGNGGDGGSGIVIIRYKFQ